MLGSKKHSSVLHRQSTGYEKVIIKLSSNWVIAMKTFFSSHKWAREFAYVLMISVHECSGLFHKFWTWLKIQATDKHSSLLGRGVNWNGKQLLSSNCWPNEVIATNTSSKVINKLEPLPMNWCAKFLKAPALLRHIRHG